ncbi:MAG: PaaI family thioesterase [Paludibacteraceae bacterium]|nr:PaaI family thioesterase [Paludibacteraceae bacterium]
MDYTEGALSALKNDKFVQYIGVELLSASEGRATGRMVIQDFHLNGVGSVQGGALYTLADYVVAAAANSRGKTAVSLDGHIDYIKAVSSGVLTVEAKEISLKRTIAIYVAEIRNEEGALVASYQAKMFRKD